MNRASWTYGMFLMFVEMYQINKNDFTIADIMTETPPGAASSWVDLSRYFYPGLYFSGIFYVALNAMNISALTLLNMYVCISVR